MWTAPRPWTLGLLGLAAAALVANALGGCREDRAASDRRAAAARERVRRTPLPLRAACSSRNAPYARRLGQALRGHVPPFLLELEPRPDAEALGRLASGQVDLVILTGGPRPTLRAALGAVRGKTGLTVLGADVVAALANVTNRSGRVDLGGLRRALRGDVTDWRDVQGDALPFVLYTLPARSDETHHLRQELLQGGPLGVAVRQVAEVGTQLESVRRTPGGLALTPLARLPSAHPIPKGVKVLPVTLRLGEPGTLATDRAAAAKGAYPLRLPVLALWRRGDDPVARRMQEVFGRSRAARREAWLGLPPLPAADRTRIAQAWTGLPPGAPRSSHGPARPPAKAPTTR